MARAETAALEAVALGATRGVASAALVALGLQVADPIIGLIVTLVILRITWQSFITVRTDPGDKVGIAST